VWLSQVSVTYLYAKREGTFVYGLHRYVGIIHVCIFQPLAHSYSHVDRGRISAYHKGITAVG